MSFYLHIVMLSLLGGVYSYLNGVVKTVTKSSCKKLLAECISAVLAGFIGMYLGEYKGMNESLQSCMVLIFSINNRLIIEGSKSRLNRKVSYATNNRLRSYFAYHYLLTT